MENNKKNGSSENPVKPAQDKIHSMFDEDTKDSENLRYDKDKGSYELDIKSDDPDYDHPLPYETAAPNGGDDNSSYDEANPYVGDEYTDKKDEMNADLQDLGMHVAEEESIINLTPEDEFLARTPEDDRDDLDEEGYPVNNRKPKF